MRMGPSMAWICPHYNRLGMTEPFTVPRLTGRCWPALKWHPAIQARLLRRE